ncbi:MAG: DUF2029 domain-containing protein [Ruminococcus sp.]|nr:DUF2029 domain-containing protein [Ruminococcus sp.]
MTKIEHKIFNFIERHILDVFFVVVTAFGIAIHLCGLSFKSGDFTSFLNPWWNVIKDVGIGGLKTQVGNYNIPYQIIIYILTLFPWSPLLAYKTLSIIFDIVLAFSVALLVKEISKSSVYSLVAYSVTLCSMTVVFNSSFWAQCDSIYVAFILFAIYFLIKEKNVPSFVMLGVSFAFKLQVVFILPVFLFYYVLNKKISILHFFIIPAVDFVLCSPAIFLGRNIADVFTIYLRQTDYGKQIYMNCPNIFAFMCDGNNAEYYRLFKSMSILLTVVILGIMLCLMIYKKTDLSNTKNFLLTAIWTSFTCIMFLSSMHERYGYLLDILLIVYAVIYRKNIIPAIVCNLVSLRGYCFYLFKYEVLSINLTALVYIGMYLYITYILIRDILIPEKKVISLKE